MVYTWSFTTQPGIGTPLRLKGTPAGRR
jgi:hypothetical protein